ncbi:hypothetical protein F5Y18DRAFT_395696 [Xylariaceae sp. FL1019]|nr:hypothetical protein F5Y18DRAFT_395696 [Xylariaceae sp. FL1019]
MSVKWYRLVSQTGPFCGLTFFWLTLRLFGKRILGWKIMSILQLHAQGRLSQPLTGAVKLSQAVDGVLKKEA